MKKFYIPTSFLFFTFSLVSLSSCSNKTPIFEHHDYKSINLSLDFNKYDKAIDKYLDSLSPAKQISQVFLINIEGDTIYKPVESTEKYSSFTEKELLIPGGMLFFSYNINENPETIISFTKNIYQYCENNGYVPAYTAIDQEGGIVNRLRNTTSTFPSPQKIKEKLTPSQSYNFFLLQAKQLNALGFNMNLAPVSEAALASNKDFLGSRSFGSIEDTITYSVSFVKAFNDAKVSSVLKHFPGNTNTDPHSGLPEITLSEEDTENYLIKPFSEIISSRPDAILMSHARNQALDPATPSCLSYEWVTGKLRNQLNYKGLIISDDIFMGALAENGFPPERACIEAVKAGVDVIMLSEKKFGSAAEILYKESLKDENFKNSLRRMEKQVIKYKIKAGLLSLQQETDGSYSITPVTQINKDVKNFNPSSLTLSEKERYKSFESAKAEGIEFYQKNF